MSDFETEIMDRAAEEKIYEGLSSWAVCKGDEIAPTEQGNDYGLTVVVFLVKVVDGFYWWYALEKESEEPDEPCDEDYMKEIST